jgi:hypothetical protein
MEKIRIHDNAAATLESDEVVIYIDGLPFTPAMLKVLENYKPSTAAKPATKDEILALLGN